MKNKSLLVFAVLFFYAGTVWCQPYRMAVGAASEFSLKDYHATGVSFKFFMGRKSAGEITALAGNGGYYLSLLYQYHFSLDSKKQWHGYAGIGAFNVIYPRGTLGLEYRPTGFPLSLACDWRPFYEWKVDDDIDNRGLKHFGISIRYVLKN
jgi:hypothetical protein